MTGPYHPGGVPRPDGFVCFYWTSGGEKTLGQYKQFWQCQSAAYNQFYHKSGKSKCSNKGVEKVWLKGTYSLVTWFSFQHNSLVLDLSSSLAFATFNTREIRLQMALVKSANKIFRSLLDQRARICILVTQQYHFMIISTLKWEWGVVPIKWWSLIEHFWPYSGYTSEDTFTHFRLYFTLELLEHDDSIKIWPNYYQNRIN